MPPGGTKAHDCAPIRRYVGPLPHRETPEGQSRGTPANRQRTANCLRPMSKGPTFAPGLKIVQRQLGRYDEEIIPHFKPEKRRAIRKSRGLFYVRRPREL